MNTGFVVYNPEGRILRRGSAPTDSVSIQANDGEFAITAAPDVTALEDYVDLSGPIPTTAARPPSSIELSVTGLVITLSNVNLGTVIEVSGDADLIVEQDESDGTVELTFELSGAYAIRCEQFPELAFNQTVDL